MRTQYELAQILGEELGFSFVLLGRLPYQQKFGS
jgi:hypothetical protein